MSFVLCWVVLSFVRDSVPYGLALCCVVLSFVCDSVPYGLALCRVVLCCVVLCAWLCTLWVSFFVVLCCVVLWFVCDSVQLALCCRWSCELMVSRGSGSDLHTSSHGRDKHCRCSGLYYCKSSSDVKNHSMIYTPPFISLCSAIFLHLNLSNIWS